MDIETRIAALFSDRLNLLVPSAETELIESGLIDSLAFVEFLALLEEEFEMQLSLDDLQVDQFRTISRIAKFIATKTASSPAVTP